MMQSMVNSPIPTRAEVLDVANAVIDGTDAVMLSAETAAGQYPSEAVAAMDRVSVAAERQFEPVDLAMMDQAEMRRIDQAMARAAMSTAKRVGVAAIVALTESGATALWLSRFRSRLPIFGMTRHAAARRRMTLFRDVYPVAFEPTSGDPAEVTREAVATLRERGLLDEGDLVLMTMGDLTGVGGGTNTLKLLRVGD
jgi:pyruvate kinase